MDAYDRLYEELAKRLPNRDDAELLRGLIATLRTGSKEAVEKEIDRLINALSGEI